MNENEVMIMPSKGIAISSIKERLYFIVKRIFDIIMGLIGSILLIPIIIVVKVSYMLTGDFYKIIFTQERIGKNGKHFKMYKFRTMIPNAEEELKRILKDKKYKEEWDKNQKLDDDPRITKIGKFLRKGSLDEMPQFVNILKGELSLVGPRPLVPGELDAHNGNHELYESVKPGITGWWAVNGRSATTYQKRLNLEYYYCKNRCLALDIKIFFKTILVVIHRRGAK